MGLFFQNDLHDDFGTWPLGYTATGGVDVGVIIAVGKAVGNGGDDAYWKAWIAAGDAIAADAGAAEAKGRTRDASASWLQAASCYATASHPLYGRPVDPRLREGFGKQIDAFHRGLALRSHPVRQMRIPCEDTTLPGYFLPAEGRETETRPLIILNDGYDASVVQMYFASAVALSRGGYHVLFFDGPGQGEVLVEQGIPLRPDWENVIRPVVDFALTLPHVDPDRIVLSGWSLGGHLALRGASGEPRLAACVADPGLRAALTRDQLHGVAGVAVDAAAPGSLIEKALEKLIASSPRMRWSILKRGYWVQGVDNLTDFIAASCALTLEGRVADIRCPVLLTTAEGDPMSKGAEALAAELPGPATLLRFTSAEGAGDHCSMRNRTLLNRRVLAWLDETLGASG